jgi:integrase
MEELQMLMKRENRYENLDTRNKVIISLLIYQALTNAEIINLNVSNIDLDTGTIKIKASRNISGRTLYLHKSQIKLFDTYINDVRLRIKRTDTNRFILNKLGQAHGITIDGIFAVIEPLKSLFPDKILNPERIRMSVISHWLNDKKLPVEIVMDLSGQKWPSSVMMYKRIDVEEQRKIINKFHPLK